MIEPANSNTSSEGRDEIDLANLVATLFQYRWVIAIIGILAVAIGVFVATVSTPIYSADALIQVEDSQSMAMSSMKDISAALGAGTSSVAGEIDILRSREVILEAVRENKADINISVANRFPVIGDWIARRHSTVGTAAEPLFGLDGFSWGGESLEVVEFDVPTIALGKSFIVEATQDGYQLKDPSEAVLVSGKFNVGVQFVYEGEPGRIAVRHIQGKSGTQFNITKNSPIAAYRSVLGRLSVNETAKQSNIVRLSYLDTSIRKANSMVNAIAKAYLRQNVERRSAEADQRLEFLDRQLPGIKKEVDLAENALTKFRTQTNTVSVEKSTDALLTQAVDVERRRLELQLQRDGLLQRYTPTHPAVRALDEQLQATNRLSSKVNDEVNALPQAQRDLLRLQRDAEVSTQMYIAMLNNIQQLRVAKAGTVGSVRIIDFALPDPTPVAPKKTLIVMASAVLGLILGVMAVIALRMLRPTIREAAEAERISGVPVYATVPESATQKTLDSHSRSRRKQIQEGNVQLMATLQPDDPAIESLRSLRTGLTFALMGAQNKNIVITGPTAALGKSFISANLAPLLASMSKRVLLIDADLRRPQLGRYFGYIGEDGLSQVLAGSRKLEDVLLREVVSGLTVDVLPAGEIPPNPAELLLSEQFEKLLESLQDRYDHVLLDTAPVLPVADTLAVARHASTVFLVARAELSTGRELKDAVKKLQGVGVNPKGVIFNGVNYRRLVYGYKYKYYYGYGK